MSEQTVGLGNGSTPTQQQATTNTGAGQKNARGTVTSDPGLVACIKIDRLIAGLETETQRDFVLNYVFSKYAPVRA